MFGQLLIDSGLIENAGITWIAFNSKFDFAYMTSILVKDMPDSRECFLNSVGKSFPVFYDLKMLRDTKRPLRDELELENIELPG